MVVVYLLLVDQAKRRFFERYPGPQHPERAPEVRHARRVRRRSRRFVPAHPVPSTTLGPSSDRS
jgi:hypothetical protein